MHAEHDRAPDVAVVIGDLEQALCVAFSEHEYLRVRDALVRALKREGASDAVWPPTGGGVWRELPDLEPIGTDVLDQAINRLRALREEIAKAPVDLVGTVKQFFQIPTPPPQHLETGTYHLAEALEIAAEAWARAGNKCAAMRLSNLARLVEEVAAAEAVRRRLEAKAAK